MTRLPSSLDELRGLRAARWVRESTERQGDRYGPDAQREQQDRAIERYGLVDTGVAWQVHHSGRTVASTSSWAAMISAAGINFDVLVVGYVSRFARDLRTAVNARHDLHAAGAVLLFCDERVLSSDENAWETWAREAVEAEAYSRRLGKRIREGYAAKFRRLADPGGPAPMGFRRMPPAMTLAIDPATITVPVRAFELYATGSMSYEEVGAELGLAAGAVREFLRNPVYNGWVRRRRRARDEERQPAAWRDTPPVDDELWERVQQLRWRRTRRSGPQSQTRPRPLLSGILHCVCDRALRSNGTQGLPPRAAIIHPPGECEAWGSRRTQPAELYTSAIEAQITRVRLDDRTISRVAAYLSTPEAPRPGGTGHARLDRRRRELALEHAANRLTDDEYLAGVNALRAEPESDPHTAPIAAEDAVAYLRALPELWRRSPHVLRRQLVATIYERIVVAGTRFAGIRLTRSAIALGLALALPSQVELVSREGARLVRSTCPMPIEGRAVLEREARRLLRELRSA